MKSRHQDTQASTGMRGRMGGNDVQDELIDWLRDAYAMERGLEGALRKQSENNDLSESVRQRAAMHLEETQRHAEAVKAALQSLGTDTSTLKTGMGMMAQTAKGATTMFARDEEIKDLLDAYSMEHFEIACYTALAAGAERAGLTQLVETCRSIIRDEERMAQSILQALPQEIHSYLSEHAKA